jgi:hypothetical protein
LVGEAVAMHVNEKTGHRCYYSCKEATGHITQWLADDDEEDEAHNWTLSLNISRGSLVLYVSGTEKSTNYNRCAAHFPRKETNRNKEAIGNATGTTQGRFVNTLPQQCLSIQ